MNARPGREGAVGRVAIVSAMAEELNGLLACLRQSSAVVHAGRTFHLGRLEGRDVVLVLSRIGKVAAATTAAVLLTRFDVDRIVFTGVAGGLGPRVRVGDIVVAGELLQHDMDASPLFPRYEVPLYGAARFAADAALTQAVHAAASAAISQDRRASELHGRLAAFGIQAPRVHRGLVLSGDRFVCTAAECGMLQSAFPDAQAVEMEGAAVAQVCRDFGVPFAVMRTISDRADDNAHVDFNRFIGEVASHYTAVVAGLLMARLPLAAAREDGLDG